MLLCFQCFFMLFFVIVFCFHCMLDVKYCGLACCMGRSSVSDPDFMDPHSIWVLDSGSESAFRMRILDPDALQIESQKVKYKTNQLDFRWNIT
jgi:hypothetical protein